MKQFESTVTRGDGRHKVRLPWKDISSPLEDNRVVAEHRLRTLVKRLRRSYSYLLDYDGAMRKYLEEGHAGVVTDSEPTSSEHVYYMPHQAVRESSTTTKLRVVFDASAHAPNTAPLNAYLEQRPKLNTELIPLLLRFHTEGIALVSDIAQALLQVVVGEKDRDALRFLWYKETPAEEDPLSAPQVWRMTRVPFGTTSSPFLLAVTIIHHLNGVEERLKATASKLTASFYVDDPLTGASCEEDTQRIYKEAIAIMRSAGMHLRKWASNSKRLNQLYEEQEDVGHGDHDTGLLGLRWDRQTDSLKLAQHNRSAGSESTTKRTILQVSASVFDPLGFVSPFTICSKILFQRIWQAGVGWDEDLPVEMVEEWTRWVEGLPYMQRIETPRFVSQGIGDIAGVQVHVFTDASPLAYGAVAYLRTEDTTGGVSVILMISKARVSPLKTLTLPRLELMGALVGCRLAKVIWSSLTNWPLKFYFWTDSSIVLQWIKGSVLRWKQFVRNRVTEVQSTTDPASWRHCPGKENPADLLTRGEKIQRFSSCKKWLKGPE
ncbi:uncharacterized protein LOC135373149 [Ornithodoros turicata]|uniref:uncharacterized protein LOC135373149 n=1 Tax=Ornithodoros turicata TaxID=34597 RepID=UPI0031386EBA